MLEQFKILLLNNTIHCLGVSEISTGGMAGCILDEKGFDIALKSQTTDSILANNYQSGPPTPSAVDVLLTKLLSECVKLFGVDLLDHITMMPHQHFWIANAALCAPG